MRKEISIFVLVAFVVFSVNCICPVFDTENYPAVKCQGISDHRLCISAALNSYEQGCGDVKDKSEVVEGGQAPAHFSSSSVNCQMRAAQIRVHVLYHGKNSTLGDGGECQRARIAFINDTCSHFPTCAAEACILAGFGPVNSQLWSSGFNETKHHSPEEVTIKHKEVAKMLMPRNDLRRFAGVLGLEDPDEFWRSRDPKPSDEMDVVPVELPIIDASVGGEIQQEFTKAAIRLAASHSKMG
eukprot:c16302_g1_i1.p1 GENE.c16302_g1_i1~~c16302_g1_i1.p1  ORF type:complete len:241 (+),score=89.49 c16302_g1_i1:57-779(+)